ncbi:hypothetical protein WJR50_33055 [Catalinimonas sp. 4WD22]|uniref:hypothetical protein n=1 Tax=Catalinimonas locisalis TaxID=3133978 RepID=UPI00310116B1
MEFAIIILQIITSLLATGLIFYVREKAKNQAQLEDIKELTKSVEEVKQRFTKETEYLRAELQVLTSKKSLIFTEEKEAIIQYFANLNQWFHDGLSIPIVEYNNGNLHKIQEKLDEMEKYYNQTNIAYSRVELFIEEETLVNIGHVLNIETMMMHHFCKSIMQKVESALKREKAVVDLMTSEGFDINALGQKMKDYYLYESRDSREKREKAVDEYFEKIPDYSGPVGIQRIKFIKQARNYLNS